jgi:SWI/SNF-related matrix-associated actin-dependent regulator 1 of chromatin subfamily A
MNFILPKILGPEMDALRAVFKTKGDSKVALLAQDRVTRAKRMMTPFVLRRRKEHVSGQLSFVPLPLTEAHHATQVLKDLPKKHERIEWCDMTPLQRQLYDEAVARSRRTVVESDSDHDPEPVKKKPIARNKDRKYAENSSNVLMDLRKASSHTMLFRTRYTSRALMQLANLLAKEDDWKKLTPSQIKEDLEQMSDMDIQRTCYAYNVRNFCC